MNTSRERTSCDQYQPFTTNYQFLLLLLESSKPRPQSNLTYHDRWLRYTYRTRDRGNKLEAKCPETNLKYIYWNRHEFKMEQISLKCHDMKAKTPEIE